MSAREGVGRIKGSKAIKLSEAMEAVSGDGRVMGDGSAPRSASSMGRYYPRSRMLLLRGIGMGL